MEANEKIECLREKANVSYEEAEEAFEQAGGDMLDAIVLLERRRKAKEPEQGTFSAEHAGQKNYLRVRNEAEDCRRSAPGFFRTLRRILRILFLFLKQTVFIIKRKEDTLFTMPTAVFALMLFFAWRAIVPVMIIAMFFKVRYSFDGMESVKRANTILYKAGDFADDVRNELVN